MGVTIFGRYGRSSEFRVTGRKRRMFPFALLCALPQQPVDLKKVSKYPNIEDRRIRNENPTERCFLSNISHNNSKRENVSSHFSLSLEASWLFDGTQRSASIRTLSYKVWLEKMNTEKKQLPTEQKAHSFQFCDTLLLFYFDQNSRPSYPTINHHRSNSVRGLTRLASEEQTQWRDAKTNQ